MTQQILDPIHFTMVELVCLLTSHSTRVEGLVGKEKVDFATGSQSKHRREQEC